MLGDGDGNIVGIMVGFGVGCSVGLGVGSGVGLDVGFNSNQFKSKNKRKFFLVRDVVSYVIKIQGAVCIMYIPPQANTLSKCSTLL